MYQYAGLEDTIVAVSTAMGQGGIGIIRLSGKEAISIVDKVFVAANKKTLRQSASHTIHYGWIYTMGKKELVDEVLVSLMRAPRSYTRQDVVEVSCHGGGASLQSILKIMCEAGARLAEPGEFTKRAFLNGRIDLAQAEAVLDVVQSKTEAFLKVSAHQLKGELSKQLESVRQELMNIYVEIEAVINFPEDDTEAYAKTQALTEGRIQKVKQRIERLLISSRQGTILKNGIRVVLCGKPNVGKSSLLNVLLKTERAIVSPMAGTTRDTIEEIVQIKGIPFQLIDTAGMLEPRDPLEVEAVKRSQDSMQSADLILLVLDYSRPLSEEDFNVIRKVQGRQVVVVMNKCDLRKRLDESPIRKMFSDKDILALSVLKKTGLQKLEEAIMDKVWHGADVDTHGVLISNLRHINALKNTAQLLEGASQALRQEVSLEFISEDIKRSVNFLDSITGRNVDADLLDSIFSQFCIGK